MTNKVRCANMNHGRYNAPVRFCPSCGESINPLKQTQKCDEFKHNARRKERSPFCQDCGTKLMI